MSLDENISKIIKKTKIKVSNYSMNSKTSLSKYQTEKKSSPLLKRLVGNSNLNPQKSLLVNKKCHFNKSSSIVFNSKTLLSNKNCFSPIHQKRLSNFSLGY